MNWFERTRKHIRSWSRRADREERQRLPSVLARVSEKGSRKDAVNAARKLTDLLKRTFGNRNPEFARGLSSLAILAIARGEYQEAESLLVRVLTIRKGMLGPLHPETIDTKERLESLRQLIDSAVDSPLAVVESTADSSLPREDSDRFEAVDDPASGETNRLGHEEESSLDTQAFNPANPTPSTQFKNGQHSPPLDKAAPIDAALPPSEPSPRPCAVKTHSNEGFQPVPVVGRVTEGLADEIAELSEEFASLAVRMTEAAARVAARGELPSDDLIAGIETVRRDFERRRSRLRQGAADLRFEPPSNQDLASLGDLSRWLDAMAESERRESEVRLIRSRAIESLSRLLSLSHVDQAELGSLGKCREHAYALRETIARTKTWDTPDEAKSLAEGNHPINDLLILVSRRKSLNDAEWSDLYDSVAKNLGGELAAAAVRGKLKSSTIPQAAPLSTNRDKPSITASTTP